MKKVNFSKIAVENIDGTTSEINLRREFANALYSNGKTLDVVELARKIWHSEEETELTEEEVKIVEEYVPQFFTSHIIKTAILTQIK